MHAGLAASTGVLFGVNSVTGVWNLMEARKDPTHRKKRTIHGILMLAADAGFFATALTIPEHEGDFQTYQDNRSTHRTDGDFVDGHRDGRLPHHAVRRTRHAGT